MSPAWLLAVVAALPLTTTPEDRVRAAVRAALPDARERAVEVRPSAVPGLYEAAVGTRVVYVSADGQHLLAGPLYALGEGRNLTEERMAQQRADLLTQPRAAPRITYEPGDARFRVTVVTNVDCPYCRHLHQDLARYLEQGIALEYVMTPFGGQGSEGYNKTARLLCAPDPAAAITRAMNGLDVEGGAVVPQACSQALDAHMRLARELGAATTPNFILPDGRLVAGYLPPDQLLTLLER